MYYEWVHQHVLPGEAPETQCVNSLLLALLHTAGFQCPTTAFSDDILTGFGPDFVPLLSPRFKQREAAKKAVICACRASTVNAFRSIILSTKRPDLVSYTNDEGGRLEKDIAGEKKLARKAAKENHFPSVPRLVCSNPACAKEEEQSSFQRCPCQEVCYCCKACQVANWPTHKHICRDRAAKKKGKK